MSSLPEYYQLLHEAVHASVTADNFDPHRPVDRIRLLELESTSILAQAKLLNFVLSNFRPLIDQLRVSSDQTRQRLVELRAERTKRA